MSMRESMSMSRKAQTTETITEVAGSLELAGPKPKYMHITDADLVRRPTALLVCVFPSLNTRETSHLENAKSR